MGAILDAKTLKAMLLEQENPEHSLGALDARLNTPELTLMELEAVEEVLRGSKMLDEEEYYKIVEMLLSRYYR